MLRQLEKRKLFQSALGQFAFEFAELEFSLLYYWGIIDKPKSQNVFIAEKIGKDFEERRKKVTTFIHSDLPSLKKRWDKINTKLSAINLERRYLIHGIGQVSFNDDAIKSVIMHNGEVKLKNFTISNIKKLSNDISHLLKGTDGLAGEFLIDFTTQRFNLYNENLFEGKIIYRVNGEILTDFKG